MASLTRKKKSRVSEATDDIGLSSGNYLRTRSVERAKTTDHWNMPLIRFTER